nr:tetratricopeptide repeat protein [Planktothrix agardhii]
MQNQPNTTSSSSSTTVDRHGISWIEDPTSTTSSSSQTSNPIVDNDFLSGSQHFFDIDELLRNLIGQKDLVSREEFKPGETIYLCVRCQLGYHEESYQYINNRCDQCQTNDKITAYTLPHHLSFDDYYNQGISAFNQKKYEQAINTFTRALSLDPNHADAYVWRSDAYIQLGQYQQTIEDCTQIISIDSDNIPAYVRRGFARLSLEEYQQSLEDSNRAISLISLTFNQTDTNSWLSQAYAQQGDAHQSLGNTNEAIENYQKALDIVPNDDLRAKLDALNNAKNHLFEQYFNQGVTLFNQENYQQAIEQFTRALTLNPNHIQVYGWRREAYIQLDQYQQAIEDCTQIIRIDPLDIPAYVRRGFAHLSLGEYQQAIKDSNKAIILSFNQTTAHSWLSQAYVQQGDAHQSLGNSNEAIENYQKALDIAPNDDLRAKLDALTNAKNHLFEQYFNHGINLFNKEKYQQAIEQFTRALTLNHNDIQVDGWRRDAYIQLGQYQQDLGNTNEAIENYQKALDIVPNDDLRAKLDALNLTNANNRLFEQYFNQGITLVNQENYQQAIEQFTRALSLNPNHANAYVNRAFAQIELGEYQQAIDDCKEAIRLNPNHVNAHQHLTNANNRLFEQCFNQGINLFNQEKYEPAIEQFTKALTLNPNHTDAYVWRSNAYIQLDQYEQIYLYQQTIEYCTQIISIDPHNIPAYVRRGFAHLSLGEYQQAVDEFEEVIRLNPNYADAYVNRANAYNYLKNYEQALNDCNQAIRLNPNYADAYINRAFAQMELGEYQQAIDDFKEAIRLNPNHVDAHQHLNNAKNRLVYQYFNQGINLVNKENCQQAIEQFTRALTLNPNHTDAYVWRSNAYIQLDQYEQIDLYQQTIEDCTQIIRVDPHDIPAYVRRGFAHLSLGEYQQSLEDSNRAISLISLTFNQTHTNSWLSQAYTQRGDAHQALGNSNEAIENYQKALDIAPNDDLQAKLDALQNQVTQSSQVSTNILTFDEFYLDQIVENQENTAQVNKMLKILGEDIPKNIQLDVEIDNFSKKPDDNPFEMEFVFQEILDILLESNELDIDASYDPVKIEVLTDQAHEDIEILFEEADHEISTIDLLQELQLAKEKLQARDYEAAIEKFNLVLNHNPDEFEAYYHRGIAYAEVGLYSNAIGDFNKTIALNKYNAEAYFQRGMIYKQTGDYKQAIRDFEFTLFFKPNHSLAYQNKRQLMNL